MNKHTPGKWEAVMCDGSTKFDWVVTRLDGHGTIASVQAWPHNAIGAISQDEANGNARLIAASPELLEAIKAMLPWIEHAEAQAAFAYCALPNAANIAIAQAKAAIAKAEGE